MDMNFFYDKLGYGQLTNCSDISSSMPEYRELERIGADKVYFSCDFPAILFREVTSFDAGAIREIAEIQRKAWNYRKVIFLFVLSDTEIRIYNCYEKPKYLKPDADVSAELDSHEVFRDVE
jgi:predicted TIM-barrel fold metal-dependent hydrolase